MLKIENRSCSKQYFDVEKYIKKLLMIVPKGDLIGIERIVLIDEFKIKKRDCIVSAGQYFLLGNGKGEIVIAVRTFFESMPKIVRYLPGVKKFLFVGILFHEIGHHNRYNFTHGINKSRNEDFAEWYSDRMMKKKFWLLKIILNPFRAIIKFINRKING